DDAAWIDALEAKSVELAAVVLEVPPWNAVLRADDHGVGPEERAQLRGQRGEAVRFHAEKHDVGGTDRAKIGGDVRSDVEVSFRTPDAQSALLHRAQMRTAGKQHDIGAGTRETRADIAANGAGAGNDDSHDAFCEYTWATTRR